MNKTETVEVWCIRCHKGNRYASVEQMERSLAGHEAWHRAEESE